jgi:hypothetical protein
MAKQSPPKQESKWTYTISISQTPTISGYGGFDEWTVYDLTSTRATRFLQELDKLIEKHGGQFTGAQ